MSSPACCDPADRRAMALLATVAGVVYVLTMAREAGSWDSPERVLAAAHLGFSHPPGDPFHALVGHAFVRLGGFLSPASAVNLLSVVAGAGAAVVQYATIRLYLRDRRLALGLAATTAFSLMVWAEALYAEVYGFAWFLWSATLFHVLRWCDAPRLRARPVALLHANAPAFLGGRPLPGDRDLVAAAFLFALAFSTQATLAPWAATLALLATLRRPAVWLRPRTLAWAATATLLGLSPYFILPLRAEAFAFLGSAVHPDTPRGFAIFLAGTDRSSAMLVPGVWERTLSHRALQGGAFLAVSYLGVGLLPLLLGVRRSLRVRRAFLAGIASVAVAAGAWLVGWRATGGMIACLVPAAIAAGALRQRAVEVAALLVGAGLTHFILGVHAILDYPTLILPAFVLVPIVPAMLLGDGLPRPEPQPQPPQPQRHPKWLAPALAVTVAAQLLLFPLGTWWAHHVRPFDPASERVAALPSPVRLLAKALLRKPCLASLTSAAEGEVLRLEDAIWTSAQSRTILIAPWEVVTRLEYAQRIDGRFTDIWLVERTHMPRVARLGRHTGPSVIILDPLELAEVAWPSIAEVFSLELEPVDLSPWRLDVSPLPVPRFAFDEHVYRLVRVTGRGSAPAVVLRHGPFPDSILP